VIFSDAFQQLMSLIYYSGIIWDREIRITSNIALPLDYVIDIVIYILSINLC
jgi:hypothetical protein